MMKILYCMICGAIIGFIAARIEISIRRRRLIRQVNEIMREHERSLEEDKHNVRIRSNEDNGED